MLRNALSRTSHFGSCLNVREELLIDGFRLAGVQAQRKQPFFSPCNVRQNDVTYSCDNRSEINKEREKITGTTPQASRSGLRHLGENCFIDGSC